MKSIKLIYFENMHRKPKAVRHLLCDECNKNNISCLDGDEICLPLEMFVQLCGEKSTMGKLEMIDNVSGYLDLD